MPRYRPAPPLLPKVQGRPIDQFEAFFRGPDRVAIVGPEGRVASFRARELWTYQAFVKPFQSARFGKPEQRFDWIADTLEKPSGIWRQSGNPRPAEFFISRYVFEQTNLVFVVKGTIIEQGPPTAVDPTGYQIFRGEDELQQKLLHDAPPCWSPPDDTPREDAPEITSICLRVKLVYGPIAYRIDRHSWTRHFRQLESNHPRVRIVEVSLDQPADYWVLDTNTSDSHTDTGSFQAEARAAGAIPLAVNTPSNLVVKESDGRTYLFSMRMRAR